MAGMERRLPIIAHEACPAGSAFVTDGRTAVRIDLVDGWAIFANAHANAQVNGGKTGGISDAYIRDDSGCAP